MSTEIDRAIATEFSDWTPRCPGSDATPRFIHAYSGVFGSIPGRCHICPECHEPIPVDESRPLGERGLPIPEHERDAPPYSSDIRWAVHVLVALYERGYSSTLELRHPDDEDSFGGVRVTVRAGQTAPVAPGSTDTPQAAALAICETALRRVRDSPYTTEPAY